MFLIVLAVFAGVLVLLIGIVLRKRVLIYTGVPAGVLLAIWLILASWPPNAEREFGRLFGVANLAAASDIRAIKPTFMDGHFISFRMRQTDFDARIRPQFTEMGFGSPANLLLGQSLPKGWPPEVETALSALHREVEYNDVYLLYFPAKEMAYASVRYDQW